MKSSRKKLSARKNKMPLTRLPPELKFIDFGIPVTQITNAPTTSIPAYLQSSSLNLVIKGDGNDQREGSRINAISLEVYGELIIDKNSSGAWNTTVNSDHIFRIVIYLDKQCNQAAAPITNIFDYTLSASEFPIGAARNLEFIDRFVILSDQWHRLPAGASVWDGANFHFPGSIKQFSAKISINKAITYTDNLLNIASVTTNNIGILIMTSASAVTQRKVAFRSRLNFTDY